LKRRWGERGFEKVSRKKKRKEKKKGKKERKKRKKKKKRRRNRRKKSESPTRRNLRDLRNLLLGRERLRGGRSGSLNLFWFWLGVIVLNLGDLNLGLLFLGIHLQKSKSQWL
jgi:hypothetical protein